MSAAAAERIAGAIRHAKTRRGAGRRGRRGPGDKALRRVASALLWILAGGGLAGGTIWALTLTGVIQPLVVVSDSMQPAMAAGDLLLAVRVPTRDVHPGDVVSVSHGDRHAFVTHRVVATTPAGEGWSLTLRGDANPIDDPEPYAVDDSVLKVVLVVPLAHPAEAAWADAVHVGLALATAAAAGPPPAAPPSPAPFVNPHILGGQRTAVWDDLTCPDGTTSWEVRGTVDNASGHRDAYWSGGGQPPASLTYQWLVTWGHWTVAGAIACYGTWGVLSDSRATSG